MPRLRKPQENLSERLDVLMYCPTCTMLMVFRLARRDATGPGGATHHVAQPRIPERRGKSSWQLREHRVRPVLHHAIKSVWQMEGLEAAQQLVNSGARP